VRLKLGTISAPSRSPAFLGTITLWRVTSSVRLPSCMERKATTPNSSQKRKRVIRFAKLSPKLPAKWLFTLSTHLRPGILGGRALRCSHGSILATSVRSGAPCLSLTGAGCDTNERCNLRFLTAPGTPHPGRGRGADRGCEVQPVRPWRRNDDPADVPARATSRGGLRPPLGPGVGAVLQVRRLSSGSCETVMGTRPTFLPAHNKKAPREAGPVDGKLRCLRGTMSSRLVLDC
jgi:hypothetical protein